MNTLDLKLIDHLPIHLEEGVLYVSEEFEIAGHLCPCGCGSKIITPLGVNEWTFSVYNGKPTLKPSIGNWQLPCQSHYWIDGGKILWSYKWSEDEIKAGQLAEELQRKEYYEKRVQAPIHKVSIWESIKKKFSKIWHNLF